MSGIYPDIVEKSFQEESFYIHRRFLPFGRTDLTASASLRPGLGWVGSRYNNTASWADASPRPDLPLQQPRFVNNPCYITANIFTNRKNGPIGNDPGINGTVPMNIPINKWNRPYKRERLSNYLWKKGTVPFSALFLKKA
jgi:hypothetical protein